MKAPIVLDDTDRSLIEALRVSPRATNKSLAAGLGISEASVATRIKRLIDEDVVRITAQSDITWLGDELMAFVDIYVQNGAVKVVSDAIAKLDYVNGISVCLGDPELIIQIHARNTLHLSRDILRSLGKIPGIIRIVPHIALEILKYMPEYGRISAR